MDLKNVQFVCMSTCPNNVSLCFVLGFDNGQVENLNKKSHPIVYLFHVCRQG